MYGLLLENMKAFICEAFGEKKWNDVKDALKLKDEAFGLKDTFPEGQLIKMGKKAQSVLSVPEEEFYEGMGIYFVGLTQKIGYFRYIEKLGRELRDFFLNLDNLHDYLKFIFPRLKPPSFFIEEETESSMKLQYRSKRRGFHYYVQGQTKEVAKQLFGLKIQMKFQKQEVVFDTVVCTFTLEFDNSAYAKSKEAAMARKEVIFHFWPRGLFEHIFMHISGFFAYQSFNAIRDVSLLRPFPKGLDRLLHRRGSQASHAPHRGQKSHLLLRARQTSDRIQIRDHPISI